KPEEETIDVDGILKCYLGHSRKFSNVVPQFLFVKDKKGKYSSYLPIFGFTPSQMIFADHDSYLSQGFDLAGGYCGSYKTSKNNHIKKLKDNSHLYKVCITVPKFYKSFLIKNVIWKNKI